MPRIPIEKASIEFDVVKVIDIIPFYNLLINDN